MNLKKHYEPTALAAWREKVDSRVSVIRAATGLSDDDARKVALSDKGIEAARATIPVTHIEVRDTGASPAQNFSHRFVEDGVAAGWITLTDATLTIKAEPEDLAFALVRRPGYYCTSTGERIPVSDTSWNSARRGELANREALRWLTALGKVLTDYEVTNAYECVLSAAQHEKFRKVPDAKGRLVGAHRLTAGHEMGGAPIATEMRG